MDLFDDKGQRLYLNNKEREQFKIASERADRKTRTFCLTLFYTGCRISEALELVPERIDFNEESVVFRTLKKRSNKPKFRNVPAPPALIDQLNLVHGIHDGDISKGNPLWLMSRTTAWRRVCEVMKDAGLKGIHATPKGLRHSYGVNAIIKNVPLNKLRDWMGHSDMKTTAIYANALGDEEKQIAARMWD